MRDLLRGCSKAGIAMPNASPVPESIIVWHNPHADFPGDTVAAAHDAAREEFGQAPDIIFVILPERGECLQPPPAYTKQAPGLFRKSSFVEKLWLVFLKQEKLID